MGTIELKKQIKSYVDQADDRMLHILNAIIQTDLEEQSPSQKEKEILNQRLRFHGENPTDGKTWNEVRTDLKAKYDL